MSAASSSSEELSPRQIPTTNQSPAISPLALPTSNGRNNDNDTNDYIGGTIPRAPLDRIVEHVRAEHIQLQNRSRVGSVSGISFKTTGLKHPTYATIEGGNKDKAKRKGGMRDVSPPAAP
ncbi:uncharacterized protein RCO7_05364 [Rhynchosporium graminicola]|uniref:Uncharacterized protein n=1 Tax=Rhynchosporium graminicola TaxID=2792576 RepID=A0A1E1L3Y3_9HELO|nr:uncharacterized protein RCO7_05364 [Rhynchosporium commune]